MTSEELDRTIEFLVKQSADFWVGAVKPENFAAAQQSGASLPQLHSGAWAPDYAPTLKMVMTVETTELLELLGHERSVLPESRATLPQSA